MKMEDGNFAFQTDPAKSYSLYIPSSYDANTPNKMMLGLHPFNTARWNGVSWCDTLINFAETNNLILVCPDGGADGKIDDAIDTAFTSTLLDSARLWYNVDTEKTYVMGFSWGARTTYTYGLNRPSVFGGYLPIGAAITNTNEVNASLQNNSTGKPVYILHGGNDSPNTRFYPVRTALINSGAIVNSLLQSGVGHTIDFPNRDAILTTAYNWIDSVNCANITVSTKEILENKILLEMFPNPITKNKGLSIKLTSKYKEQKAVLYVNNLQGKELKKTNIIIANGLNKIEKDVTNLPIGTYMISVKLNADNSVFSKKVIIE